MSCGQSFKQDCKKGDIQILFSDISCWLFLEFNTEEAET